MQQSKELINIQVRHQVLLERLKTGQYKKFNEVIDRLDAETRRAILDLDIVAISALSKRELQILITELRTLTNEILGEGVEDLISDLRLIAESEGQFEVDSLERVLDDVRISKPAKNTFFTYAMSLPVRAAGVLPKKFFGSLAEREADSLSSVIVNGWIDGLTVQQMVARIRGTRQNRYNDGFTKQQRRRVEAQVRTGIQHVASTARERVWLENKSVVESYQWVSTLDSRTTQTCRSLDGQIFEVGQGPRPPIHYNCRSTTVPVIEDDLAFLDQDATRASAKGQVDANLTYYDWLKQQPREFQDTAIGPTRGKLLRDGGLSSKKFAELNLNRRFEPLTLEEMQRVNPVAFERAGIEL